MKSYFKHSWAAATVKDQSRGEQSWKEMPVSSILPSFFSTHTATGVYKETGCTAQQAFPQAATQRNIQDIQKPAWNEVPILLLLPF